jgi:Domain of unknown function (DUF5618)
MKPETIEALRYITNAKDILREKAKKEDGYYQDKKYVRMAGHTAYLGVLVALDELLGKKKKGRKSVEWYQSELSKIDRKVTLSFATAYQLLHLDMSYDGTQNAKVANLGFEEAEYIINWVNKKLEISHN